MKAPFVGLLLAGAVGAVAPGAAAFTCQTCAIPGACRKLASAQGVLVNTALPVPGGGAGATDRANAINNALAQWRKVVPDGQGITFAGNFTGTHNVSEAPSQVSFATPGSLFLPAGAGGIAFVRSSILSCQITSFDILLSTTPSYIPPPDSLPSAAPGLGPDPGWHIALHEFGHALGLAIGPGESHPLTFAIMRPTGPFVSFGAFPFLESAANLAPDDAAGARFLYGSRPNTRNLASSQTQLITIAGANRIDRLTPGPFARTDVSRCAGQTIDLLPIHTVNTGTTVETVNHKVYMQPFNAGNPWDAFHPSNITLAQQFGAVHNAGNGLIIPLQFRIPCNTAHGRYNVLHFADSSFAVPEYNELDNTSLFPDVWNVNCTSGTCIP